MFKKILKILKELFLKDKDEDEKLSIPIYEVQQPTEPLIEFNVREIVTDAQDVSVRAKNKSPLILCQDMDGKIERIVSKYLEDYEIIEINTVNNPGPFNIFAGMKRSDVKEYERFLAPVMEQTILTDLSRVLLHSILLSMIETNDLSWKKFTALLSSVRREQPEYVTTAIDDEICQAFKSFKDLTKNPEKILNEFEKYKTRDYWDATQGIVQDNDRIVIFFRNYADPVMNKILEYKLRNV